MRRVLAILALLLVVLGPRLPAAGTLGSFQTAWMVGAHIFIDALRDGRLEQTFVLAHPGVPVMWAIGSGFWLESTLHEPLTPVRELEVASLAIIAWTTLGFLLLYWALARMLLAYGVASERAVWTAWVATALLALEPMVLTLTQVVNLDGPLTVWTALAVALYLRAQQTGAIGHYVVAGMATAVAVLTKTPALIFVVAMAGGMLVRAVDLRRAGTGLAAITLAPVAFALASAATFIACWPAMWVAPTDTLAQVVASPKQRAQLQRGNVAGALGGGKQTVGEHAILDALLNPHHSGTPRAPHSQTRSPWLYYPGILLFKMTPLSWIALLLGLGGALVSSRAGRAPPEARIVLALTAFALFYLLCMSLGAKKVWRYVLPLIGVVDLAAGIALVWLAHGLAARWARPRIAGGIVALALGLQAAHTLAHYPHFLTYYNPLTGGRGVGEHYVRLNWGEGLAEAAHYLETHAHEVPVCFKTQRFITRGRIQQHLRHGLCRKQVAEFLVTTPADVAWSKPLPATLEYVVTIRGVPYVRIYRYAPS